MSELKPCPFCGSTDLSIAEDDGHPEVYASVQCDGCDADGPSAYRVRDGSLSQDDLIGAVRAAAVDAWNRRAP